MGCPDLSKGKARKENPREKFHIQSSERMLTGVNVVGNVSNKKLQEW
jgi:hypothetical protein